MINPGAARRSSKPKGLSAEYARQFQDASVVAAYCHRPPYPPELFELLGALAVDRPRAVLDIGCGRGEVARPLLAWADRVDAVDASPGMIAAGRSQPGGDDPRLRWICSSAEDAPLMPPYALVTAGSSLHWMDWDVVLPRLRDVLSPSAVLAIFDDQTLPPPWAQALGRLIARYSTNRDFAPYNLIDELTERGLFRVIGTRATSPIRFTQSIGDYVESFHSRNGFSRQRMRPRDADAFDLAVRQLLSPHANSDGMLELHLLSSVTWGRP